MADEKILPRWRITVVAKKGRHLGIVRAATAEEAVEAAAKAFGIEDPKRYRRFAAEPIADDGAPTERPGPRALDDY